VALFDKPLAEHQVAVLAWIANGSPEGVVSGSDYKTVAAALQSRRLIKINRRRGVWTATITEDGQYYLGKGRFRQGIQRRSPVVPPQSPVQPAAISDPHLHRRVAPTVQLINDVIEAGGELPVDTHADRRDFRNLVAAAIRYNKVPAGRLLTVDRGTSWREVIIKLQDRPEWQTKNLEAIHVPMRLPRPHPLVASADHTPQFNELTPSVRARARRLLHALMSEAETRGHEILLGDVAGSYSRETALQHHRSRTSHRRRDHARCRPHAT